MNFSFFFNDTSTTEIYTLSLHDALPISKDLELAQHHRPQPLGVGQRHDVACAECHRFRDVGLDRKSTRLNSSHSQISYAVFCLKNTSSRIRLIRLSARAARC